MIEYNWPNGRRAEDFPLMDQMAIDHLDGFSPSVYFRSNFSWPRSAADRVNHALNLGRKHNKPVITWIWEREKSLSADRTIATYNLVPHEGLITMLDRATADGVHGVIFWSNTLQLSAARNPARVIPETLAPNYEPADVYTGIANLMAETRRAAR